MSTSQCVSRLTILVLMASAAMAPLHAADAIDTGIQSLAQALNGDLQNRGAKKLATFDFIDIRGYRSALDAFLAEELTTQLMRAAPGKFTFVERRQLSRVLDEQKLTASNAFDEATLANVGKILGLDAMITGTIADLGTQIRINARAITIQTGEVFAAASVTLPKEGPVAELLRQNGRPEENSSPTQDTRRSVQATDVFFENRLIRLTIANANLSADKRGITLTLVLENLANTDLYLGVTSPDSMGGCGIGINNGRGDLLRVRRFDLVGLPCIDLNDKQERFANIAPRARTTVTAKVSSREAAGNLLAVSLEFLQFVNGKATTFSAGIANIEAK
ncbi:MAG: FlgO family outer membrane protein [Bryobacteraceae bacterium]